MPAIVTLKMVELANKPKLLLEIEPFCNSITEADDHMILESKAGCLTSLTKTVSKQKLSYEITYQDIRFTPNELHRVLSSHA